MRDHKTLIAWQEANAVVRLVMAATRTRRQPYPVVDQLQRAALSVQLNIAEGYALRSPKRFRHHLTVAYGSAVETAELLELARDLPLFTEEGTQDALEHCRQSQRLIRGLLKYLK